MSRAKIKVYLCKEPGQCEHCSTKTIHSFLIKYKDQRLYIGRACLQNLTKINTSGNPWRAIARLELYLNSEDSSKDKWEELFSE